MRFNILKYGLPVLLAAFCLITFAQSSTINIERSDGLLTVQIEDSPLNEVLDALNVETGIKTNYLIDTARLPRINASFNNAKFADIIDYLLKDINRLVIYTSTDSPSQERIISQIWIFDIDKTEISETALFARELNKLDTKQRSEALLGIVSSQHVTTNQAAEILIESLNNDHDALVRTRAAIGLAELNHDQTVPALIKALSDESQSVRGQSMLALGKIATEQAIHALGDILQESANSEERNLAVRALRDSSSPLAAHYLELAMHDRNRQVRNSSVQSPGQSRRSRGSHSGFSDK